MANKPRQAKVSVLTEDGKHDLVTINKDDPLQENVKALCNYFSLPSDTSFSLKLLMTKDGKTVDNFITDDNFDTIDDGQFLKISFSPYICAKRIFNNLSNPGRPKGFEDLYKLSPDPAFIKELVAQELHVEVLQMLTGDLEDKEMVACLTCLLYLIKGFYLTEIDGEVIGNVIKVVQVKSVQQALAALAVLCQILYFKGHFFKLAKQQIIDNIPITVLLEYLKVENHTSLQLNTLMLINAMAKAMWRERRKEIVNELNSMQFREVIFNHVLHRSNKVNEHIAHELYVCQTYSLSIYEDSLNTIVDIERDGPVLSREFEVCEESEIDLGEIDDGRTIKRSSNGTIVDDADQNGHMVSNEEINEAINFRKWSRYSSVSQSTDATLTSVSTRSLNAVLEDVEPLEMSTLALDCLRYYKNMHYKNFKKSALEETAYEPGILITSENVTQMLVKLLHIGKPPEKKSQFFHPLVYNISLRYPFFPELFSRTMWLLSKTRREMKASRKEDYPKVLKVLQKQIESALQKKPLDYRQLTDEMTTASYQTVSKIFQEENIKKWNRMISDNPCVQEFRQVVTKQNEALVYKKRMMVLEKGAKFPKLPAQKRGKSSYIFVRVTEYNRTVHWGDFSQHLYDIDPATYKTFRIFDVKHLIVGEACPHIKDNTVKDVHKVFSLMLEDETTINFLAKDRETTSYWIDGFSLLLGKEIRSELYKKELKMLVDMDCALQLIELQNVTLPREPPPVPPLPPGFGPKPVVPPKTQSLLRKTKKKPPVIAV